MSIRKYKEHKTFPKILLCGFLFTDFLLCLGSSFKRVPLGQKRKPDKEQAAGTDRPDSLFLFFFFY